LGNRQRDAHERQCEDKCKIDSSFHACPLFASPGLLLASVIFLVPGNALPLMPPVQLVVEVSAFNKGAAKNAAPVPSTSPVKE
jgi:uncharacterized paraquat-inducible protein A